MAMGGSSCKGKCCSGDPSAKDPLIRGSVVLGGGGPVSPVRFNQAPSIIRIMDPVFNSGRNFIVRPGHEIAFREGWMVGEWVEIYQRKDDAPMQMAGKLADAIITELYICKFCNLPYDVKQNHHNPVCQESEQALLDKQKELFPHIKHWKNQIVTAIGFVVMNRF